MTDREWLTSKSSQAMLQHLYGLQMLATSRTDQEEEEFCNTLRENFGNPNKDVLLGELLIGRLVSCEACSRDSVDNCKVCGGDGVVQTPSYVPWITHRVVAFINSIKDTPTNNKDPEMVAALADMLEECGCRNQEILQHLRGKAPCAICDSSGRLEEDSGGFTPWGEPIADWVTCEFCNGEGWVSKPVPCTNTCWVLNGILRSHLISAREAER